MSFFGYRYDESALSVGNGSMNDGDDGVIVDVVVVCSLYLAHNNNNKREEVLPQNASMPEYNLLL
jgi:hypothetical protein